MTARAAGAALADEQLELARALGRPGGEPSTQVLAGVIPGGTLDAAAALDVYRNGYFARLTEQLGEIYASVWRVLGDEEFFALCRQYIAGHASSSYNLSDYGRELPGFLEGAPQRVEWPMLPELARFELAFHDLFHAPAHASIDARRLAGLEDLAGVRFRIGSSVRLLRLERAVYDVFRHRNDENPPDIAIDRPQRVLLYKQRGDVLAREIDEPAFCALESLAGGSTVDEALARAALVDGAFGAAEAASLFELIARCGLIEAIER